MWEDKMTTSHFATNIAGDIELQDRSNLAFEMPVRVIGTTEVVLDEFNATVYLGARLTVTVTNELGQIEISEFMIVHDGNAAFMSNLSTVNNLPGSSYISTFRAELLRGAVRILITGTGAKSQVRFFKLMFKK